MPKKHYIYEGVALTKKRVSSTNGCKGCYFKRKAIGVNACLKETKHGFEYPCVGGINYDYIFVKASKDVLRKSKMS
jgi:hypothetical protein